MSMPGGRPERRCRRLPPGELRPPPFICSCREHQLRLRDDGGELAVAAGDARLQHDGGAAAVQRHADGAHGVALLDAGEEVGLAFDRGGAPALGHADAGRHPSQRVAQRHHRTAVKHVVAVQQFLTGDKLGLGAVGRVRKDLQAKELGEGWGVQAAIVVPLLIDLCAR